MSPRRGNRAPGRSAPRTTLVWVAVVVVVLLVVDVVLVTMAFARTAPETNGTPGPIPTFTSTPSAAGSPSATATAGADQASVSTRRLLSAVDGLEAWRASSTSCHGPQPVLEHSVDGGHNWKTVALDDDVRTVSALRATTSGVSVLAGVGDDCERAVRTRADGATTWTTGQPGDAGAGITADGIVVDSTVESTPCPQPVDAFRGARTTVVVCDGQLEWRDGTGAWVDVPLGGVRGIAVAGDEYTLARIGTPSCAGVQIETMAAAAVTPETTSTPVGCDEVTTSGPIAVDRVGRDVWLWAGPGVDVSGDGGATW